MGCHALLHPRTLTVASSPTAPRPSFLSGSSVSPPHLGPKLLLHRCQNLQLSWTLLGRRKVRAGWAHVCAGMGGGMQEAVQRAAPGLWGSSGLCGPRNTAGPVRPGLPALLWTQF